MPFAILAGAGVFSSLLGVGGALGGASIEANAANQAAQLQYQMFQQEQGNERPFVQAGQGAVNNLAAGLGTPGAPGPWSAKFNPQNLQNTPGYQFQLQQGEQAVTDQATATGGVGSGNTLKALTQYGQGLAGTTFQQQLQDYMAWQQQNIGANQNLAALGSNAGSNNATGASTFGANIGSEITGAGNAGAAGLVGAANAAGAGVNNLSSNYLLSQLLGGSGAFGGGGSSYNPFAGGSG